MRLPLANKMPHRIRRYEHLKGCHPASAVSPCQQPLAGHHSQALGQLATHQLLILLQPIQNAINASRYILRMQCS